MNSLIVPIAGDILLIELDELRVPAIAADREGLCCLQTGEAFAVDRSDVIELARYVDYEQFMRNITTKLAEWQCEPIHNLADFWLKVEELRLRSERRAKERRKLQEIQRNKARQYLNQSVHQYARLVSQA